MPDFGRLDYLTRVGWVVGHAGISLQDPEKYVTGLAKDKVVQGVTKNGTIARFVPLDGDWRAGSPVLPPVVPDFPNAPQEKTPITRISECAGCGDPHEKPWECVLG